ncbi:MAG: hypothetical protein U0930_04805 [Pirellulales bacterium]
MNYPHYPEFHPIKYKVGDRVQVADAEGNLHPGEIIEITPSGKYRVQSGKFKVVVAKEELFPAPQHTNVAPPESPQKQKPHDQKTLSKHLQSGGKAYYHPSEGGSPVPIHDVWMGKEENLPQLINFDAVAAGNARIENEQPESKTKSPRFRGLTTSEVGVYLRSGSKFTYFDDEVKYAKRDGGYSLNDMMSNRDLATDENVQSWFDHQMEMEQTRSQPSIPKPTSLAATSNTQGPPQHVTDAQGVNWTIDSDRQMHGTPPGTNGNQNPSGEPSQSTTSKALDAAQTGLDAVGVADPTPISDGLNMVTSLIRAGVEPERAGEHLKNAAVSAVSMIPYVGDTAKAAKYGGKAAKEAKVANAAGDAVKATDSVASIGSVATGASEFMSTATGSSSKNLFSTAMEWWSDFSSRRSKRSNAAQNSNASAPTASGSGNNATGNNAGGNGGAGSGGGSGGSGGSGGGGGAGSGGNGPTGNSPAGNNPSNPCGGPSNAPVLNLDKLKDQAVEAAGTIGALAKKAYDFADHLDTVNRQMIEYNRSLTRFSGTLSAAYGKLDSDRILREIKSADVQGESLAGLVNAQSKLEEALGDFKNDWRVVGNDIQQILTNAAASIIEIIDLLSPIEEMWPYLRKLLVKLNLLDKKEGKFEGFPQKLQEIRKQIADMQRNPRKVN